MAARKLNTLEDLSESWVELNSGVLSGESEYIKLLREAQRESRDSSVRHSRASSVKGSPKSPPNSPNLEPSTEDELKGVYINCWRDDSNDWVWEWSSRPDQMPPKDWRFKHPAPARGPPSATSSIEVLEQLAPGLVQSASPRLSVRGVCLFSRGALAAVLVTNVLSLLVGAGIGVWLSRRGMLPPRLVVLFVSDCFTIGSIVATRTCYNEDIEGEVLAFDTQTKMLILKCPSSSGDPKRHDVNIVNLSLVSDVQIKKEVTTVPEPPQSLNLHRLNTRVRNSIEHKKRLVSALSACLDPEGQRLFLAIARVIDDVSWAGQSIRVYNEITITPPYKVENVLCEQDSKPYTYIRKFVERHWREHRDHAAANCSRHQ